MLGLLRISPENQNYHQYENPKKRKIRNTLYKLLKAKWGVGEGKE
jgi:hypothetical protein